MCGPWLNARAAIQAACDQVVLTKALLEKAKIPCPIVTGAGSGSFMFEVESGAWNEIQPGSYVFMDADYARNEWARAAAALRALAIRARHGDGRPAPDRAIVDAGLKASSVDSGMPSIWQNPGLMYAAASDEHGTGRHRAGSCRARPRREAPPGARPLRPHGESLRLVRLREAGCSWKRFGPLRPEGLHFEK